MGNQYLHPADRAKALLYIAQAAPLTPWQGLTMPIEGAEELPALVLRALDGLAADEGGHWSRTGDKRAKAHFGFRGPMSELVIVPPRRCSAGTDIVFDAGGLFPLAAVIAQRGRYNGRLASSVAFVSELTPFPDKPFHRLVLRVAASGCLLGLMALRPRVVDASTSTRNLVVCWQLNTILVAAHHPWPDDVPELDLSGVLPQLGNLPAYLSR